MARSVLDKRYGSTHCQLLAQQIVNRTE
jgi:hypothetical protein